MRDFQEFLRFRDLSSRERYPFPVQMTPAPVWSVGAMGYQEAPMGYQEAPRCIELRLDDEATLLAIQELEEKVATYAKAFSSVVDSAIVEFIESCEGRFTRDAREAESANDILDQFEDIEPSEGEHASLVYDDECLPRVANQIKKIMAEKSMSQAQLAEIIGVSPASISKVLKSPEKSKIVTLAKIARALNVSLEMFFKESPMPNDL